MIFFAIVTTPLISEVVTYQVFLFPFRLSNDFVILDSITILHKLMFKHRGIFVSQIHHHILKDICM
jgi:hypothetical protein